MARKFTAADIEITAKDKTKPGVDSAKKGTGSLTDAVKRYGVEMAAVAVVAAAVIRVVKDLTEAYFEQERAIAGMEAALKATGTYTPELSRDIQELASGLQTVSVYGDEATIAATGMLQSLAKLSDDGLMQAIPLVHDLAAGMGLDLVTAASLIGKTLGSTTNALSRYGIVLDATAPASEKLIALTEQINSSFGGMAEAMGDTAAGSMVKLTNAVGDLKEAGGHLIMIALRPVATWLTNVARNAAIAAENIIKAREEFARIMGTLAIETIREQFQMPTLEMGNLQSQLAGITEQIQTTIVEMAEAGATAAEIFTARRDIYAEIVTQIETLLADINQVNEMGEDNKKILQFQLSMYRSFLADIDERIKDENKIKTILNDQQTAIFFINELYQETTEYAQEQAAAQLETVIALLDFWKAMHPEEEQTIRMLEAVAKRLWDLLPPMGAIEDVMPELAEVVWDYDEAALAAATSTDAMAKAMIVGQDAAKDLAGEVLSIKDAFLELEVTAADWARFMATTVTESVTRAFSAIGLAIANQRIGWKELGQTALQILADILRSIGAQLAAMAVILAIQFRWVAAALAVAGSIAAFVAAAVIEARIGTTAEEAWADFLGPDYIDEGDIISSTQTVTKPPDIYNTFNFNGTFIETSWERFIEMVTAEQERQRGLVVFGT